MPTINGTTSNEYIVSKIELSYTQSVSGNYSDVTAKLYLKRTNSYATTSGTGDFTINLDGKAYTTKDVSLDISTSWVKAAEASKRVYHEEDGTRSIEVSASGSLPPSSLTSISCSGTVKLDTIKQPTINCVRIAYHPNGGTVENYEVKSNGYILIDDITYFHKMLHGESEAPYKDSFFGMTRAGYEFVGWKVAGSGEILDQNTAYASTKYVQYNDASITTANKDEVRCHLRAQWKSISGGITLDVSAELLDSTNSGWGLWLQKYCKAKLTAVASSEYGDIVSYSWNTGETTAEFTTEALTDSGLHTWTCTVTDSRGETATAEVSVWVVPVPGDLYIPYVGNGTSWDVLTPHVPSYDACLPIIASAVLVVKTATGEFLCLTDSAARPIEGLKAWVMARQEGEGTPSADNVRPIIPYEGTTVTIGVDSDENMSSPTLYSSGTLPENCYGGYVDWARGVFVQTHEHIVVGKNVPSAYIRKNPNEEGCYYFGGIIDSKKPSQASAAPLQSTGLCDSLTYGKNTGKREVVCAQANVWCRGFTDCATIEEFHAYITEHPANIIYPLETPIEHPIADMPADVIRTLYPVTYMASDGSNLELSYMAYETEEE